jgi:hypothetical protein
MECTITGLYKSEQAMKNFLIHSTLGLLILITSCASSPSLRLTHSYSIPQALRFVRQVLLDRGYGIAIFDTASGVVKTERREYTTEDGHKIRHQISVTVIKNDELLIRIIPASARHASDEIMTPIFKSLQAMGFHLEQVPGSSTNP